MSSNSFSLKDIFVGQEVDHVWQVTAKQIDQFSLLSGDYNPLHVSAKYAVDNGYQDRVAHGFLFGAQLSGIIGMLLPGERCLLLEEQLAFPEPIYPKDTILINCTVKKIWEDLSLIELKVKAKKKTIDGREGQTVARGKVQCKIRS
jgi:3-hydroxybutyryl-CoA dehydratase